MRRIFKIIGIILILSISCTISFTGGNIKGSIKILPIQCEKNIYGIEGILGSELYDAFREDGRFKISDAGEYTLKLIVREFKKEPFFYEGSIIKGYKYSLFTDFSFIRNTDTLKLINKVIKEEVVIESNDEIEGMRKIAIRLKEDIIKSILELW